MSLLQLVTIENSQQLQSILHNEQIQLQTTIQSWIEWLFHCRWGPFIKSQLKIGSEIDLSTEMIFPSVASDRTESIESNYNR